MSDTTTPTTSLDMLPTPGPVIPGFGTLAAFRNLFLDFIDRSDISTQQANWVIQQAIGRLNRELRVPFMEQELTFRLSPATGPMWSFALPEGFLEFQMCVVDGIAAVPTTYERWLTLPAHPGRGAQFARDGGSVVCKPPAHREFRVKYYGAFDMVTDDNSTSLAFTQIPDLLLWACATKAGEIYGLDQTVQWEANYQRDLASANLMAQRVDRLGGSTSVGPVKGYQV